MYTRLLNYADLDYWQCYNKLIPLHQFWVITHSHHIYLWLSSTTLAFQSFGFQKFKKIYSFDLECNSFILGANVHKTFELYWYWLLTILQWTNITSSFLSNHTFSSHLPLVIFLSVLPWRFKVSGFKSLRKFTVLI